MHALQFLFYKMWGICMKPNLNVIDRSGRFVVYAIHVYITQTSKSIFI